MTTKSEILHKAQNLMGQIVAAKKEKATPEKKAWEATLGRNQIINGRIS